MTPVVQWLERANSCDPTERVVGGFVVCDHGTVNYALAFFTERGIFRAAALVCGDAVNLTQGDQGIMTSTFVRSLLVAGAAVGALSLAACNKPAASADNSAADASAAANTAMTAASDANNSASNAAADTSNAASNTTGQ